MGVDAVHDYVGGKSDWVAAGLALEGTHDQPPPLVQIMRTGDDVATCGLSEPAGQVLDRIAESAFPFALATNDQEIVLGKALRRQLADLKPDAPVGEALVEGPTTVRAHEELVELTERMRQADTGSVVVTSGQGELLGVLQRGDAEEVIEEARRHHEHDDDRDEEPA